MKEQNIYPSFPVDCKSLVSKYLKKEIFEELKELKTKNGFTLEKAIASGVQNFDSGIGVYAGDLESYTIFASLFDPIIEDYHQFKKDDKHKSNLNAEDLKASNPDLEGKYIVS
ncbi:MAG: arginine kinase, partial [Halarcobacter sp.]